MKIYMNLTSSSCFKVFAFVHELGVKVEYVPVDLANGEQKKPWFLAINPIGKVPALSDGEVHVWESNAVLCYLAAKVPEREMLPSDARSVGEVQKWLHWQSNTFSHTAHKVNWQTYYAQLFGHAKDEKTYAEGMREMTRDLQVIERGLTGREYLAGRLSVADFSVACSLLLRDMAGVDVSPYPHVKAWLARMEARESMKHARPKLS